MSEKVLVSELPTEFVDQQITQLERQFPVAGGERLENEYTSEQTDLRLAEGIKLIDAAVSPEESERLTQMRMSKTSGRGNLPWLYS